MWKKIELLDSNLTHANIKYPDEGESPVSVSDLAPFPEMELTHESPKI